MSVQTYSAMQPRSELALLNFLAALCLGSLAQALTQRLY